VTYAPDEPALASRLKGATALGEAWRCLRCGDWVLGEPSCRGPAAEAPVPPRGRALRQLALLRLLAVERVVRGLVLIAAAYGVWRFSSAQTSLRDTFGQLIPALRPLADRFGVDLDQSFLVREATRALQTRRTTLDLVTLGLLAYGLLEGVEGVGLWRAKRWAEYLTVVATAAFLPLEVYELTKHVTPTKVVAFVLNIAVVVYLLWAKRLFGLRGGTPAYERELRGESLLEVEAAAADREFGRRDRPGRGVGMSGADAHGSERPA
jgi:uncharacterized membrane protein (DUF2068 family)